MPTSEVYNEDCMIGMARYPDKFFDLAIVDPPYGGVSSFNNRRGLHSFDNTEPNIDYFNELLRVSVNQIIWGWNYLSNCNIRGGGIVWNKLGRDADHRKQAPTIGDAEFAFCSLSNNIKIFSYAWMGNVIGNNYQINPPESKFKIHPTEKPISLYKWLLHNYAKPGDKILDTHLGSQSSRIAAWDGGFDFWGWELDPDYFRDGCKRFDNHIKQLILSL